jgi:hypothetical protein
VRYFDKTGGQALSVYYAPPGGGKRAIPANGALEGAPDARVVGSWGSLIAWPHIAISVAQLADGRDPDLVVDRDERVPEQHRAHARRDLRSRRPRRSRPSTTTSTTCSARASRRSRTAGSWRRAAIRTDTRTSAFNPQLAHLVALANMNSNRWYATLLALPSNELFTTFANAGGRHLGALQPGGQQLDADDRRDDAGSAHEQNAENGQTAVNTASDLQVVGSDGGGAGRAGSCTAVRPRPGTCSTRAAAARCSRSASPPARARACGATS